MCVCARAVWCGVWCLTGCRVRAEGERDGMATHGGLEVVDLIHPWIPLARVHHPLVQDCPLCHGCEDAAAICVFGFRFRARQVSNDVEFLKWNDGLSELSAAAAAAEVSPGAGRGSADPSWSRHDDACADSPAPPQRGRSANRTPETNLRSSLSAGSCRANGDPPSEKIYPAEAAARLAVARWYLTVRLETRVPGAA